MPPFKNIDKDKKGAINTPNSLVRIIDEIECCYLLDSLLIKIIL